MTAIRALPRPQQVAAAAWNSFWFSDGDPRNLAAARVIVAVHALWVLLSRDIPALSGIPSPFWSQSRGELAQRFLLIPGMTALERGIETGAATALVLVTLGLGVRYAAPLAALALYHLAPLQTLLATVEPINRGLTIDTLALLVLAASPCADRWSLSGSRTTAAQSWEYGWPLRLMWLFVAEIYLFGAVGKLRSAGLDWFTADNLRRNLVLYLHMHPTVIDPLTNGIASRPLLLQMAALSVLLLEGSFVLALVSPRARRVLVPAALGFHLMILRTMRIVFANLAHLGLFVNWGWLADRLMPWLAPPPGRTEALPVPPPSSR